MSLNSMRSELLSAGFAPSGWSQRNAKVCGTSTISTTRRTVACWLVARSVKPRVPAPPGRRSTSAVSLNHLTIWAGSVITLHTVCTGASIRMSRSITSGIMLLPSSRMRNQWLRFPQGGSMRDDAQPLVARFLPSGCSPAFSSRYATRAASYGGNDLHAWPSPTRAVPPQAGQRFVQAHPPRVPAPYPPHQVRHSERGADLDRPIVCQPHRYGGRGLRPGSDGILDRRERRGRVAAELVRIPGVHRRLVPRLPWHVRTA